MISRRQFLLSSIASGATIASSRSLVAAVDSNKGLELGGRSVRAQTTYRRMFPTLKGKLVRPAPDMEKGLIELGSRMTDSDEPVEKENQPQLPPAGYTYFGQFIDHDLTFDLTPLATADKVDVDHMQNFRTPFLDLDHVYGGGPNLSPFLYEKGDPNAERFLIGKSTGSATSDDDLPRNSQGIALVGDPRQDENLILAQLHLAFLKLHNFVIAQGNLDPYRHEGESDFVAAQRAVKWHYQWAVCNDYLRYILHPSVFKQLPAKLKKSLLESPPADFKIPIEFSAAAFRFGHSMVRDVYKTGVNKSHGHLVKLHDFLQQTGIVGGVNFTLPAEWVVCWNRFFFISDLARSRINRARKIDTQIANELHQLESPLVGKGASVVKPFSVQLPNEPFEPRLPVRTLLRGFRMRLPSGEEVASQLAIERPDLGIGGLQEDQIVEGPHKDILTDPRYGLRWNTPLWYYLLKEAEITEAEFVINGKEVKKRGTCLGPIGSWIVANVILNAVVSDEDSYLRSQEAWKPTLSIGPGRDAMGKLLGIVFPNQKRDSDLRCRVSPPDNKLLEQEVKIDRDDNVTL